MTSWFKVRIASLLIASPQPALRAGLFQTVGPYQLLRYDDEM
jgi:hypothetical protein